MIQITCEICMDLHPLVQDGVAAGTASPRWSSISKAAPSAERCGRGRSPTPRTSGPDPGEGPGTGPVFLWG